MRRDDPLRLPDVAAALVDVDRALATGRELLERFETRAETARWRWMRRHYRRMAEAVRRDLAACEAARAALRGDRAEQERERG